MISGDGELSYYPIVITKWGANSCIYINIGMGCSDEE